MRTVRESRSNPATGGGSSGGVQTELHPDTPLPLRTAGRDSPPPHSSLLEQRQAHLIKRQATVLSLIAEFVDRDSLVSGLTALAEELHHRFQLDRLAVGLYRDAQIEVSVISQQASKDAKSTEMKLLGEAMREACEQDAIIHYPSQHHNLLIIESHRILTAGRDLAEVCTVPMSFQGQMIGAIVFERTAKQKWSDLTLQLFRQIAVLLAPMVTIRQQAERSFFSLLTSAIRRPLETVLQPRYLFAKSASLVGLAVLIGSGFLQVSHTVTAASELVPTERRLVAAPSTGYIESVEFHPGDQVSMGDLLLKLDTRDLELERTQIENEIRTSESEFRSAMASHDRKEMAVSQARKDQARARLDLIAQQIARSAVTAPTSGIILTGDLSQALGAPVERGDTLLEIAPEAGYKVNLQVNERDVEHLTPGQNGTLVLTASPVDEQSFTVQAIHPIAIPENGRTTFRVEAQLTSEPSGLRPGQTGVAKVVVGQTSLLWLWTHRFVDWMRLTLWELAP